MVRVVIVLVAGFFSLSSQQTNYCDPKLCPSGEPHIACNGLNKLSTTCGPGAQEVNLAPFQDLILDLHNQLRNRVALGLQNYTRYAFFPQAVRMPTLQWDTELATVAATNARRCIYGHDECRSTVRYPYAGQNIGLFSYYALTFTVTELITDFIYDWYSEYTLTTPAFLAKYPRGYTGPDIGHFTQIVSDRTNRIGCSLVTFYDSTWINQYFVCNYALINLIGQTVYVAGTACSKCTTGCSVKYPGLCNTNEVVIAKP
ncbi:hypothetical protein quinque_012829 [Culex quinquefasciatus]|uniref:venom allergen 3 homolog n=1 Tax=Culex quinquefasciatus TaxID=7176 RepID=UPI0018E3BDB2|nr:venom allergen 3 homolog [Culex quinquefasciatus]